MCASQRVPKFYFVVHDVAGVAADDDGAELADFEAACRHATAGARSIMSDGVRDGMLDLSGFIEIEDQDRVVLDRVNFRDALKIT